MKNMNHSNLFSLQNIITLLQYNECYNQTVHTDYFNCLTKTAVQENLVIPCIVLSTDNSSHFVSFCLGTSPMENRSPVDVTS